MGHSAKTDSFLPSPFQTGLGSPGASLPTPNRLMSPLELGGYWEKAEGQCVCVCVCVCFGTDGDLQFGRRTHGRIWQ